MYRLRGFFGIYCDAVIKDQYGQAVFVSLIGNDSSIQELAAKLSLSAKSEGSIQSLTLDLGKDEEFVFSATQLSQKNAQRLPESSKFKGLHVMWSSKKLHPQFAQAGSGFVMFDPSFESEISINDKVWQTIRQVSKIPLLESWKEIILRLCFEQAWVTDLESIGKIEAFEITLPAFDEFADSISELVRAGHLTR